MAVRVSQFSDPVAYLQATFLDKKRRNPRFSLRAWAKQLAIPHAASLSSILRGRQDMSDAITGQIIEGLRLNADEARRFELLVLLKRAGSGRTQDAVKELLASDPQDRVYQTLSLDLLRLITDWRSLLILEMTSTKTFRQITTVRTRFGEVLKSREIDPILGRLTRLGLVENKDGMVKRTKAPIASPGDVPDSAMRDLHRQFFQLASQAMDCCPIKEREISLNLMKTSKDKIEEAKKRIKKFRRELSAFLSEEEGDTVYAFNVALYELLEGEE